MASFDEEEVFQCVIAGLKRSPQFTTMPQYSERKTFLKRVVDTTDDLHGLTCTFSVSLAREYSKLMGKMKRLRANDRFSEFQVEWLQLIRTIASTAERLAFESAQAHVDEGELEYQASAISSSCWSSSVTHALEYFPIRSWRCFLSLRIRLTRVFWDAGEKRFMG